MKTVYHKTFGQGELISVQGLFSTVIFNGEEKKLLSQTLSSEPIIEELKKNTKQKKQYVNKTVTKTRLEELIYDILCVNHYTYTKTTSIHFLNDLYKMRDFLTHKNYIGIALDIVTSIIKYKKASEKQANTLANTLIKLDY
ncbi:hypothetical protein [Chryseobacterium mucoviscidosis]|uniref:hypothetical protein n=1 Tax=Chryseobacterium mucoviscidosis TaxID=1945581 RepID=UPI0030180822